MSRILIQIVPALPPATNGVGDYALAVARVMRSEFGLDTLFVVGNAGWQGPEEVEGFAVRKTATRSAVHLAEVLEAARKKVGWSSVLLQLSGYGYSHRGCPLWLLKGLKRWKAKQTDARLVTMFHELYAWGPPWTSTFWISPVQKMVVAGLARLSDVALTNTQLHRGRLEQMDASKRGRIEVLAIPSNVGEPLDVGKLDSRTKSMVVFGQVGVRKLTYETQMAALQQACEQLGIMEVHDIGPGYAGIPERVDGVPVRKHGVMDACDLSGLMSASLAGFVTYSPESLAKSSVFASYCAHRLVPVVPLMPVSHGRSEADGIAGGVHYHSVDGGQGGGAVENGQTIADAAWQWYQGHSVRRLAQTFVRIMQSGTNGWS